MATLTQLERALVNAHNAGDGDAARKLAKVINVERKRREAQPGIGIAERLPGRGEDQVPNTTVAPQGAEPSFFEDAVGLGEAALTFGTGATGGAAGMVEGIVEGIVKEIVFLSFHGVVKSTGNCLFSNLNGFLCCDKNNIGSIYNLPLIFPAR